jgi:hypothetical protein
MVFTLVRSRITMIGRLLRWKDILAIDSKTPTRSERKATIAARPSLDRRDAVVGIVVRHEGLLHGIELRR